MRILYVTAYPPYPSTYGGSARVLAILERLASRHRVHLLSFIDGEPTGEQRSRLAALCASVEFLRQAVPPEPSRRWFYLWHTLGSTPPYVKAFDSPRMRIRIAERWAEGVDVVQLEWTQMAQYVLPEAAARTVVTEQDIFFDSLSRYARADEGPLTRAVRARRAAQMRGWELGALSRAAGVFAVSEDDRARLADLLPGTRVAAVPNGAEVVRLKFDPAAPVLSDETCARFAFVGGLAHEPNLDGLRWLLEQVWPKVRARLPDATIAVLGPDVPDVVRRLAGADAEFAGYVADTQPYLARAVSVVPIRLGAGVRMKLLEAFAAGSPVVSTSMGKSGVDAEDGEHLLVADEADAFADAMVRLARERETRQRLARAGRSLAEERYDWDAIVARQEEIYAEWFGAPE